MGLICWIFGHRKAPLIRKNEPPDSNKPAMIVGSQSNISMSSSLKILDENRKLSARTEWCDRCMTLLWVVEPLDGHPKFKSVWVRKYAPITDPGEKLQEYSKKHSKFVSLWLRILGISTFEKRLIKDLLEEDLKNG